MEKSFLLSERDARRVEETVRWQERIRGRLVNTVRRRLVNPSLQGIFRAKLQTTYQPNPGLLSAKRVDGAGTEIGDAINVYAFPAKSATNVTGYLPKLAAAQIILVSQVGTEWFLMQPTLIKKGSGGSTVNSVDLTASDDVTGAALSGMGEW